MAVGMESDSERPDGSRRGRKPRQRRSNSTARDAHAPDDALRLAVEALSAEICWFVANDAGARGVFAAATESRSNPPTL
jgi:hypothetical protein